MKRKKPFHCLGFGEFENKCADPVTASSPFWCERCEKLRREHLGKQFENLGRSLMRLQLGKSDG